MPTACTWPLALSTSPCLLPPGSWRVRHAEALAADASRRRSGTRSVRCRGARGTLWPRPRAWQGRAPPAGWRVQNVTSEQQTWHEKARNKLRAIAVCNRLGRPTKQSHRSELCPADRVKTGVNGAVVWRCGGLLPNLYGGATWSFRSTELSALRRSRFFSGGIEWILHVVT
jgi:hypothetical protein